MNDTEKSFEAKMSSRLEKEVDNIEQLQGRWDEALTKLYGYFGVENNDRFSQNKLLCELEEKTLQTIEREGGPIVLGFAGPGGAGKGTVKEQVKNSIEVGDIINSTTREKRDYEIDGVHYNFINTEKLASGTVLMEESLNQVKKILNLEKTPDFLTKDHLDKIQNLFDEEFQKGKIEDGIDLFPNTNDDKNNFLNLTLRPLRGWYGLSINGLDEGTSENRISSFEESAPNMLRIGEGVKEQGINFYLIYVLPEQPIAETMARRALKRDGLEQTSEKLLSTIGGRQVLEFEKMVEMLLSGDYSTKPIFLLNDEGLEENGQFITRTGQALVDVLK